VSYVVGNVLFLDCTDTMLQAACLATDLQPDTRITESHSLIRYKFPRLLVTILDAAEHLMR
jgi:hypothetical protein